MPRFTKTVSDDETLTFETELPSEQLELVSQGWVEETPEELAARTVPELKDELKAAGLPTDGKKADLVERLSGTEKPAKS